MSLTHCWKEHSQYLFIADLLVIVYCMEHMVKFGPISVGIDELDW